MDKIVIKDQTNSNLLLYVIFFFLILLAIPIFGIATYGPSVGYVAFICFVLLSIALTFLYYKNHRAFVQIDATSISYQTTKGLSKNIQTKWNYNFKDNVQIVLEASTASVGDWRNRTDSINVIVFKTPFQSETKKAIVWLDSNTKSRIQTLIEKNDIRLVVK